jgi:hypothetical protein
LIPKHSHGASKHRFSGGIEELALTPGQVKRVLLFLATFLVPIVHAAQPIKVEGSEFINSVSGKRFQMIGVAYENFRIYLSFADRRVPAINLADLLVLIQKVALIL